MAARLPAICLSMWLVAGVAAQAQDLKPWRHGVIEPKGDAGFSLMVSRRDFAAKQGLDIRKVYEVITASAGNSWMFENRMPHVLDGDYTPRSAVDIFVKDLGIIQDMARTAKFPVPVSAAALQMFLMTSAAGMGRDDDASVARMYAQVTGTKLPGQ